MLIYLLRRLAYVIPTLIGVNLLVFALFFLVNTPDDMAREALGDKASSPEQLAHWKASRGYDLPLLWNGGAAGAAKVTRTVLWTKSLSLLWGDLGRSDMTRELIGPALRERVVPSLCVSLPVFLATLLLNIVLAMQSARRRGGAFDMNVQLLCVLLMSVSSLIYIIAGQYAFAKVMRLTPVSGFQPGRDMALFLALPVVTGVVSSLGGGVRLYRTLFLEEMGRDYVRTARAKGLSEARILYVHVLRNALIPIVTNVPLQLLMLMTGNMLLENFFSIPGLGGYTIGALRSQDFAVVRTMVFLGSVLYMLGMLLSDICYCLADPRVRLGGGARP